MAVKIVGIWCKFGVKSAGIWCKFPYLCLKLAYRKS